MSSDFVVDDIDRSIVDQLRINGRATNQQIADKLGLTATTVSAASYARIVAPEAIVAAFGNNLAATTRLAEDADPGQPGVQLPTLLGGVSVEVNSRSAGMRRASE